MLKELIDSLQKILEANPNIEMQVLSLNESGLATLLSPEVTVDGDWVMLVPEDDIAILNEVLS